MEKNKKRSVCQKKQNSISTNSLKKLADNNNNSTDKSNLDSKSSGKSFSNQLLLNNHNSSSRQCDPNDFNLPGSSKTVDAEMNIQYTVLYNIFPDIEPEFIENMVMDEAYSEENLNLIISHILRLEDYPRQHAEKTINHDRYEFLKNLFPDADPDYLLLRAHQFQDDQQKFDEFVDSMLIPNADYPRLEAKRQREHISAQILRYTDRFDVAEYLKLVPNPLATFKNTNRRSSLNLNDHHSSFYTFLFLRNHFNHIRLQVIRELFHYLSKKQWGPYMIAKKIERLRNKKQIELKNLRKKIPLPEPPYNIPLLQEIAFIVHEKECLTVMKKIEKVRKKQICRAKNNGTIVQCECCFNSEILPDECIKCVKGHQFCKECIQTSTAIRYSEGLLTFPCLNACDEEFQLRTLQLALEPTLFSNIARKHDLNVIKSAGLIDLESCPFCDFLSIPADGDKLFHCLNEECLKESCRKCKGLAHLPLSCEEFEGSIGRKNRHYVESKMSEALLRRCRNCGVPFFKEEGCNRMTCRCGAMMCYICCEPVKDYTHFNGLGGDRYDLCPLFSDTNEFNKENVLKAAKEAKTELLCIGEMVPLEHDPSADVVEYYEERGKMLPKMPSVN